MVPILRCQHHFRRAKQERCEAVLEDVSRAGLTVTAINSIYPHREIKPNGRRDATASEEGLAAPMKEARQCKFPTASRGR